MGDALNKDVSKETSGQPQAPDEVPHVTDHRDTQATATGTWPPLQEACSHRNRGGYRRGWWCKGTWTLTGPVTRWGPWEAVWRLLGQLDVDPADGPAIPSLGLYLKQLSQGLSDGSTLRPVAAWLARAWAWRQPPGLAQRNRERSRMRSCHRMSLGLNQKEPVPFAAAGRDRRASR